MSGLKRKHDSSFAEVLYDGFPPVLNQPATGNEETSRSRASKRSRSSNEKFLLETAIQESNSAVATAYEMLSRTQSTRRLLRDAYLRLFLQQEGGIQVSIDLQRAFLGRLVVRVAPTQSIDDVRRAILMLTNVNPSSQRLYVNGTRIPMASHTIAQCGIKDNDTIVMRGVAAIRSASRYPDFEDRVADN